MLPILPIIMNKEFERVCVVDDYISFIWTTRYYTCGDFELKVDVNAKNKETFKKDFYVLRDDDENVGIIENIEISVNEDQQEIVKISGRFLSSILDRRIISAQTQLSATVSNGVRSLIINEVINPVQLTRKIENFKVINTNFTQRLDAQYTGKNLLEVVEDICATYSLGHKTLLSDKNTFDFQLINGVDRSYNQKVNPYVVFSDEYDNLLSSVYLEDYKSVVTDVLVAGEGEGTARKTLWVTKENKTGLNRYEEYKDQRNLSSNEGEITDAEYQAHMKEEGLESITTYTTAFEGAVYFDSIGYKQDVFVGDVCVIENTRWGIYINSRLVEVIESVGESGEYTINPTFGI